MKRPLILTLVGSVVVIASLVVALLIAPRFLDINRYKGTIEKLASQRSGLSVHLDGDISLSLFPWVVVSLSDLRLERAAAPGEAPLVQVASFDARLKTLPLLTKDIEISTVTLSGLDVRLRKAEDGTWNWQDPATVGSADSSSETGAPAADEHAIATPEQSRPSGGFALKSLQVDQFSLTDGRVIIEDQSSGQTREITGINLLVTDASLDRPIPVDLQARLNGQPLTVSGTVGPLGPVPLAGDLPFALKISAFETVEASIQGRLTDLRSQLGFAAEIAVEPFNLKQLLPHIRPSVAVTTSDPVALQRVALLASLQGTARQLTAHGASLQIDETAIDLERLTVDFTGPRLDIGARVDELNLDRYLPAPDVAPTAAAQPAPADDEVATDTAPSSGQDAEGGPAAEPSAAPTQKSRSAAATTASPDQQADYTALRSLAVKASIAVGKLEAHGAVLENVAVDLRGEQGLFHIKPLDLTLYQGTMSATGTLDVRGDTPAMAINVAVSGVQVGPLLRDAADKDILEGSLSATVNLTATGDRTEPLKRSLHGSADLLFSDGALIGLDLAHLARTITSGFSLEQQGERPRTDFAELQVPLVVAGGIATIAEATLKSPFIRARASGTVNLVDESLDLQLTPRLVATIKGQGDVEEHTGLAVPILVGGTISDPTFLPDLAGLARERLVDEEEVREILKSGTITPEQKEKLSKEVEKAKDLLKGLFGN
ncbi:AsmA family protein [Desulfofustis limnaeus]|uniref:Cell envelope biogenesis protein AsmA n=1 Tax=Desulfofustis limnaeus TaxID=2740163 RepID=A0ABM7WCX3_9BACT|nr:AsmA family protein [Desulfofustis limnaeus]MDX9894272.1 AsmA family protein [Desulfofustis sp.]BDD88806.1 cell envelope biogenesis protein AsmA [Desulfofustis limnaeus]